MSDNNVSSFILVWWYLEWKFTFIDTDSHCCKQIWLKHAGMVVKLWHYLHFMHSQAATCLCKPLKFINFSCLSKGFLKPPIENFNLLFQSSYIEEPVIRARKFWVLKQFLKAFFLWKNHNLNWWLLAILTSAIF